METLNGVRSGIRVRNRRRLGNRRLLHSVRLTLCRGADGLNGFKPLGAVQLILTAECPHSFGRGHFKSDWALSVHPFDGGKIAASLRFGGSRLGRITHRSVPIEDAPSPLVPLVDGTFLLHKAFFYHIRAEICSASRCRFGAGI